MFAGPNGSGKTTVKNGLRKKPSWFGIYINPDDMEFTIRKTGELSLEPFDLEATTEEIRRHFANSSLLRQQGLDQDGMSIVCQDGVLDFRQISFNSYHASVLSDFLRRKALIVRKSFSFETVMSSPDKVDFLREARSKGFRTYLYFVATEDPAINVQRVNARQIEGGHGVPEEKIILRYRRSLALMIDAIANTNRAFFIDTSSDDVPWYFAEITDGKILELKSDESPIWFQSVLDQFPSDDQDGG
jgi:predicted ABC-type ATPase